MSDFQILLYLWNIAKYHLMKVDWNERGDVAEKMVIVGIFVVLAVAAGLLITKAVMSHAQNVANTISGAPN